MNILFEEDLLLHYPNMGIAVYLYELIRNLQEYPEVGLIASQVTADKMKKSKIDKIYEAENIRVKHKVFPVPGRGMKISLLANLAQWYFAGGVDLFHCANGILPKWFTPGKVPVVATIHDMVMFRHAGKNTVAQSDQWEHEQYRKTAASADMLIAVSEFTRNEAIEFLQVAPERIVSIPIAAQFGHEDVNNIIEGGEKYFPEINRHPYFLAVSVLSPRKNYKTLLQAWRKFHEKNRDFRLIIVGGDGWNSDDIIGEISQTAGIVRMREVGRRQLIYLYCHAYGYFNLSYYEGFGIPLLEASTCGCPCCYAGGSAMDEVAGDCGIRVEPFDIEAVIACMGLFSSGYRLTPGVREKLFTQAQKFSWEKTTEKTLAVYQILQ